MRLFVAIEAPPAWQRTAVAAQASLVLALPELARAHLQPVDPELMHLTLGFLGETDVAVLDDLQRSLASHLGPVDVELSLGTVGTFGPPQRTAVAWLGIAGDLKALRALAGRVEAAVRAAGLPPENRVFSPHLTLARVRRQARPVERRAIAAAVAALPTPDLEATRHRATDVVLVRSHVGGPQPRYEVLGRYPS
jgi:2'-5' RNA ligase